MTTVDFGALGLKALYSFEHLVVGPNNQVATAACQSVAKDPGQTYNPLFLYGPAGVGKTHLMHAVAQEILNKKPEARVRYISAERFMSEVVTAVAEDKLVAVREQYSRLDLFMLDDVQYLTESKIGQEELFHIFNNMHHENHQVILAADRPPNQLTTLNKNVRSRLEWGLATDIKIPDMPTRLEILRKKQSVQGLRLDDEMLQYVAQMLSSNVRELEGFLKRMHAYVTLSHQAVTPDLVKSIVHEIVPEAPVHEPPPIKNGTYKNGSTTTFSPSIDREAQARSASPSAPPPAPSSPPAPAPPAEAAPPPAPFTQETKLEIEKNEPPSPDVSQNGNLKEPPVRERPAEPSEADIPEMPVAPHMEKPVTNAEPAPVPAASPPVSAQALASKSVDAPLGALDDALTLSDEPSPGHKEVPAVFFFPSGCMEALESVHQKFQEVIKKHKLKFKLKRVHSQPYEIKGKMNYASFVEVCKTHKVPVAIVIGPPPGTMVPEQDFYDLLSVTLDVQGVSLQLVGWSEVNKDYRYLNLALDIALVRSR